MENNSDYYLVVVGVDEQALLLGPRGGVVVPPEQAVVVQLAEFLTNIQTIGVSSHSAVVRNITTSQGDPLTRIT